MSGPAPEKTFVLALDPQAPPKGLEGAVVAIGNFDGVHRGHVEVIRRAKALAASLGRPCAVMTFEPHPAEFFRGESAIFRLGSMASKARMLERLGLDGMIVLEFNAALAALSAPAFVEEALVRRLGVGGAVVGYDFHFGAQRGGTPEFLRAEGERRGFPVEIVERVDLEGEGAVAASSTATRAALEAGDVAEAARLLGRPFSAHGEVVAGRKLGRTLGFPTANVALHRGCRLRYGIYAVRAEIDGVLRDGVASFGKRPTVDDGPPLLEVHLFDFSGDLYGREIEVYFIDWLRAEEKFPSLDALKAQIAADAARARDMLSQN